MEFQIDLGKIGVTPAGGWGATVNYEKLTVVSWGGRSYMSKIPNKGVEPGTNSDVWQLLADKGADGQGGGGGGGSTVTTDIGVERYIDGYLYWTKNGVWLLDENGNKVRAQGIDGKDGQDAQGGGEGGSSTTAVSMFKSIIFLRSAEVPAPPTGGTYERPIASGWSDGIPSGEQRLWMSSRWFYSDPTMTAQTTWSAPAQATDTADIDLEFSNIASPGTPSTNPTYWHNNGLENDIWMAVRKKNNGIWGEWSVVKIKGEDGRQGEPGADGSSIHILGSLSAETDLPDGTGDPIESGDCYLIDGDLWVWDGDSWENVGEIQGPAGESSYIFVAYSDDGGTTLTANYGTDPGLYLGYAIVSTNERPVLASAYSNWARFKGQDGFGYEYIYKATTDDTAPNIPESSNVDEYVPTGWSDDPIGVDAEYPYCWVCQRKKSNGVWGNYTGNPDTNKAALWAKWGTDGTDGISPNTSYKSIVFKRSNTTPNAPSSSDGSYASPVPTGWSDGVPQGSEILWMSTRIFSSDGESPQQSAWTTPQAVTDNEYMDYIFSSEASPATPSKSSPSTAATGDWGETADSSTIWMAMRTVSNGAYAAGSSWNVVKIKGEDGQDGRSVIILGHKTSTSQLPVSGNNVGDAWTVGSSTTNTLYVWDGDSWENAGRFNGVDGTSSYLHIKYSNDNGAHFTGNNGETPGDYIGMYVDNDPTDSSSVSDYTWKLFRGEDGFGYEYIYKLTSNSTAPAVPGTSTDTDGYLPTGWDDDPGDVSTTYPYCWVCYRKKTDGAWGSWIGSSSNTGYAALFSHYGKDGTNGTNGTNGTDGSNGKTVRGPANWESGKDYQGSQTAAADFVDLVYYNGNYNVLYACKKSHYSSNSSAPPNTNYWEACPMKDIIATKIFYSQLGYVENLGVNHLKVQNGSSIVGGFMSANTTYASNKNNGNYLLWAGSDTPSTAPFSVDKDGNGNFAGVVRASVLYKSFSRDLLLNQEVVNLGTDCADIIAISTSGTISTTTVRLPSPSSCSGRILTICGMAASGISLVASGNGTTIYSIGGASLSSPSLIGRSEFYSNGSNWIRISYTASA